MTILSVCAAAPDLIILGPSLMEAWSWTLCHELSFLPSILLRKTHFEDEIGCFLYIGDCITNKRDGSNSICSKYGGIPFFYTYIQY